jgi:membrane protein YdbS with pleckstrin-like domain
MTTPKPSGRPSSSSKPAIPNWLISTVILLVMVMWTFSIVYSASHPEWPIPASIHAVVVLVVTGLMGVLAVKGRNNDND